MLSGHHRSRSSFPFGWSIGHQPRAASAVENDPLPEESPGPAQLVPLPAWLLTASPWTPTDVFVHGPRGPILYAPRGAPTARLLDRVAEGLVLWAAPLPPDRLVPALLGAIARAMDRRLGSATERAQVVRPALRALFAVAAGRGSDDPRPGPAGKLERRAAATAGLVGAAAILGASPDLADLARAMLAGGDEPPTGDPIVERSIDGALFAALILPHIDLGRRDLRSVLAALLLRDLPLLDRGPAAVRSDDHPLEAAARLRPWITDASILDAVARHHERPDGAGYPRGLRGADLTGLDLAAAAGDAVAGALPPGGLTAGGGTDVLVAIRFVLRRFPSGAATVAVETVADLIAQPVRAGRVDARPRTSAVGTDLLRPSSSGGGAERSRLLPQRPV